MHFSLLPALLALAAVVPSASAHYQVKSPAPRGFDEAIEDQAPCGGYNSVQSPRTPFGIIGSSVSLATYHPAAGGAYYISTSENPQSNDDFVLVNNTLNWSSVGNYQVDMPLTNLTTPLTPGQNATLQVRYDGGDHILYQCIDITLVADGASLKTDTPKSGSLAGARPTSLLTAGMVLLAAVAIPFI